MLEKNINVGGDYINFFKENLKPYYYIKNQDGFNISFCKINNKEELYCIRYLGPIEAYFGEPFIPGNYSKNKNYIKKNIKKNIKYGTNFIWNSWTDKLFDNSIFFVGSFNNKKININTNIKPYVLSNEKALTNIKSSLFTYNDIRLFNNNNHIYCYDGMITSIYEIVIINNKIIISKNLNDISKTEINLYFNNKICNESNKICNESNEYIKNYDKNWSFIDIIYINKIKYFEFLNWYENGYVTITLVNYIRNQPCIKKNLIKMDGDIINGLGSNQLPMFSFGTPMITTINNEKIGCGHIKIILNYNYTNNKIKKFIAKIRKKFNKKYGEYYIEHISYIYLMYFFKLTNNKTKMYISDAFLIIKKKLKYKFSINFPMSINIKNNKLYLSYGYGDYYNMIAIFNEQKILNFINHDVSNFNINNYNYFILNKKILK